MNHARTQDEEHLRLLAGFHYVVGGLAGLFALLPVFHVGFGLFFLFSPETFQGTQGEPPPAMIGWVFVLFGAVIMIIGLSFAACILIAGRFLSQRRHYHFCPVMAGVECLFMPLGTILGVFTLIVLMRESVKPLFIPAKSARP